MSNFIHSTFASNLLGTAPPRKHHVLHVHSFFRYPFLRASLQKRLYKITRNVRYLGCNESGVAALEFAIALPMVLVLLLGAFEMSRYIIIHQKLEKSAFTVADVVSQSQTLTIAQMNQTMQATMQIMRPYDFEQQGVVIVSSVNKTGNNAPVIRWQYKGGGTLSMQSRIGRSGEVAALPNGLTLNDKDNVIISEIFYRYEPFFSHFGLISDPYIYKVNVFKPRLGALTTPPV